MNKPVVKGIQNAGGSAILIPGMTADMKLGDRMKEYNADFGISFCGSGGSGALAAAKKYGCTKRYSMRSVDEGKKAIKDGIQALGFGFMET